MAWRKGAVRRQLRDCSRLDSRCSSSVARAALRSSSATSSMRCGSGVLLSRATISATRWSRKRASALLSEPARLGLNKV